MTIVLTLTLLLGLCIAVIFTGAGLLAMQKWPGDDFPTRIICIGIGAMMLAMAAILAVGVVVGFIWLASGAPGMPT